MILRKISYKNLIDSNFQKLSLLLQFSARSWKPCRNQDSIRDRTTNQRDRRQKLVGSPSNSVNVTYISV